MEKSYCQIGIGRIKEILSGIYGESKRISLANILIDIEQDDSVKNAKSLWPISEEDVKDHFGVLQGVLIVEAAAQSIICIVESLHLFPGHRPAFLGVDSFRIFAPVLAGDELVMSIENMEWQGKKGSATIKVWCKGRMIATIEKLLFRANSERALRRLGFGQAA